MSEAPAPMTVPAAPAATPETPAAAPAPQQTPVEWTSSLKPELKDYVTQKGFKDPQSVLESYVNLEKLHGVPKERLLKLPESAEDPTWSQVYERLGRPEKPEGYDLKGAHEDTAGFLKQTFHELGLTKAQGEKFVEKFLGFEKNAMLESDQSYQSKVQAEELNLKKEWGMAYQENVAKAQKAAREFGLDGEAISALEKAMGYDGVMKLMQNIGSRLGEDSYIDGGKAHNPKGAMTPEQAQSRIKALRQDNSFVDRYLKRDVDALQEMERLHKYAYPGA